MSREIKYRVWDEEEKKYCTEYNAMTLKHDGEFCIERGWCIISGGFEVEQSTLLKDKNGKEVYEGDVVKVSSNGIAPVNCTVKWDKETAAFELEVCEEVAFAFGNRELEVIGNIHENPEILGGEE